MTTTAYRYNAKNRTDRNFNNCGKEKNPNAVKFYATNMAYADKYKYVYYRDGYVAYECALEVVEIANTPLFDMANGFKSLSAYQSYISNEISAQMKDYTYFLNKATKVADKKRWQNAINALSNREQELINNLIDNEFQMLSDFELQNVLIAEIKSLGYAGYFTANEIALF